MLPSAPTDDPAPILVEVTRGPMVESRHRGAFALVDPAGKIVRQAGDIERPVYPRSATKPLQALPLIESGAADRLGLGAEQVALACASHSGSAMHTERVSAWLTRAGLSVGDLECGAHVPKDRAAAEALIRADKVPSALHNNCSGKHTGFLCTARCLGEDTHHYIERDHPVQQRVTQALAEMTGLDLDRAPVGRDGCGIPVIGMPLHGLARAMARLADPSGLPDERRAAVRRITDAMAAAPLMVDGVGGMTSIVMTVAATTVRLKPGAEGVFCAALPKLGLGLALKIEDGGARAADLAMIALLDRLGCFDDAQRESLEAFLAPTIRNVAGLDVGTLRPGPGLSW